MRKLFLLLMLALMVGCEYQSTTIQRRTIKVFDGHGEVIATWNTKNYIQTTNNGIRFDLDNGKHIIVVGNLIVEED